MVLIPVVISFLLLMALLGFASAWIRIQLLAILPGGGSARINVMVPVRFLYLLDLPPFVAFEIMGCCYEIFLATVGLHQGHLVVYVCGRCLLNVITWLVIAQKLFIKWRFLSDLKYNLVLKSLLLLIIPTLWWIITGKHNIIISIWVVVVGVLVRRPTAVVLARNWRWSQWAIILV